MMARKMKSGCNPNAFYTIGKANARLKGLMKTLRLVATQVNMQVSLTGDLIHIKRRQGLLMKPHCIYETQNPGKAMAFLCGYSRAACLMAGTGDSHRVQEILKSKARKYGNREGSE